MAIKAWTCVAIHEGDIIVSRESSRKKMVEKIRSVYMELARKSPVTLLCHDGKKAFAITLQGNSSDMGRWP